MCVFSEAGKTTWEFEQKIDTPIVAEAAAEGATLGALDAHGINVSISEKSFDSSTKVELASPAPEQEVTYDENKFVPQSSLYRFKIEGSRTIADEPVAIKIALDQDEFMENTEDIGGIRGMHYNACL